MSTTDETNSLSSEGTLTLTKEELREMQHRDFYRLMMHFQASSNSAEKPLTKSEPGTPIFGFNGIPTYRRTIDDDDQTVHTSNLTNSRERTRARPFLRSILLDLPLLLLFSCLVTIYCVDVIFQKYYVPMLKLSARTLSNSNLRKEYTYYDRECTLLDISSKTGEELLLRKNTSAEEAIETMMIHGMSVIPQILDVQTARELRKHIMARNLALTKHEKIPLSQGKNRASFGIDATEAPIVSEALKQVANHVLFQGVIQGLVGEDPALTEITAITAWPGAPHQAWHQDVKEDGSGIKFARTFSHSYSLFIALQDTTEAMGATTLCPGTHYCTNDIYNVCDEYGFPLSNAAPGGVWKTGDGALLNQQVWHRGAKHKDPNALERVVFIVTFIGRPDATRQLARGTYFHQKWLSWGHTMQDLFDADRSMAKPYSILRALSLWKPKSRNWGYDFVTSAILRIANHQLGVQPDEVSTFQERVIENVFHIPAFLQGPISEEDSAWQDYIEGTIDKIKIFFTRVNCTILTLYLSVISILCAKDHSIHPIKTAATHMLFSHGLPIFLASRVLAKVAKADWGFKTGKFLRPPFPERLESVEDHTISLGPTTFPRSIDVLVGSRFDAMYLGVYDRWLDFHPGNRMFQDQIEHCSRMPMALDRECIAHVLNTTRGHLLEQDWRNGCWRIMTSYESRRHAEIALRKSRNPVVKRIAKSIAILVAHNRFDIPLTRMSVESVKMLKTLQIKIFHADNSAPSRLFSIHSQPLTPSVKSALPTISAVFSKSTVVGLSKNHPRWVSRPVVGLYQHGDVVWVNYKGKGKYFKGVVIDVDELDDSLHIIYDDGDEQFDVESHLVIPEVQLTENGYVTYRTSPHDVDVKIRRVKPNGWIDIEHPHGSITKDVRPSKIKKLMT